MSKVLVVEDEDAIRLGLVDILELEGYDIREAVDGEAGLQIAQEWNPDLIILDVMLPKMNGFDVCRTLRKNQKDVYVLMLTAKTEEIDKLSGFKMGADDYMTKPFSTMELLARVKTMLRRASTSQSDEPDALCFGDIVINFRRYEATKDGNALELSAKEFQLLKYLSEREGEVIKRQELLQNIWGYSADNMPTTRTVDNQIAKLRQKIETDLGHPLFILSVRGVGYKFETKN